jgi:hypothetical protein
MRPHSTTRRGVVVDHPTWGRNHPQISKNEGPYQPYQQAAQGLITVRIGLMVGYKEDRSENGASFEPETTPSCLASSPRRSKMQMTYFPFTFRRLCPEFVTPKSMLCSVPSLGSLVTLFLRDVGLW